MHGNCKILVADDHELIRAGLRLTITGIYSRAVILEAGSGDEVCKALSNHPDLDLIILDLCMPGVANQLDLLEQLGKSHPDLPVLVVSADESPQNVRHVLELGAVSFVPKSATQDAMMSVLKRTLSGSACIPLGHVSKAVDRDHNSAKTENAESLKNAETGLTKRQAEVLVMLANGESNKSIAQELGLSEHTVKVHVSALFKALGVKNRTEAALACRGLGLLQK